MSNLFSAWRRETMIRAPRRNRFFYVTGFVALNCPKRQAGGRSIGHFDMVLLKARPSYGACGRLFIVLYQEERETKGEHDGTIGRQAPMVDVALPAICSVVCRNGSRLFFSDNISCVILYHSFSHFPDESGSKPAVVSHPSTMVIGLLQVTSTPPPWTLPRPPISRSPQGHTARARGAARRIHTPTLLPRTRSNDVPEVSPR